MNQTSPDFVLQRARSISIHSGPIAALEYLRDTPYVNHKSVIKMIQGLVYVNFNNLPKSLLEESFLDPVLCQCSICGHIWPFSPVAENNGLTCTDCHTTYCQQCTKGTFGICSCKAKLSPLLSPNGRQSKPEYQETPIIKPELNFIGERSVDVPLKEQPDMHLYFGHDGRVPIAVDPNFPQFKNADAENHLDWAEFFVDEGLYYQAQQQLDLLRNFEPIPPKTKWLRARLELVKFNNDIERDKRRKQIHFISRLDKIKRIFPLIDSAVEELPEFGPAWLTAAQIYLSSDSPRALECAQRSQKLIGNTLEVLKILAIALHDMGKSAESLSIIKQLDEQFNEKLSIRYLVELEVRCEINKPIDIDAHLQLGKIYLKQKRRKDAEKLFLRVLLECPESPVGYYGKAELLFTADVPMKATLKEIYTLCQKALECKPNFGLAYETLGKISRYIEVAKVEFNLENAITYYRKAIEMDPTCDVALWQVAQECIDTGDLEKATSLLEQAAAFDTYISTVYFLLAAIYKGTHQFEKQHWAWQKAKQLSPDTELLYEFEQKILRLCGYES